METEKETDFKDPGEVTKYLVESMIKMRKDEIKGRNIRLYGMLGFALLIMFGYYFFIDSLIRSTSIESDDIGDSPYAAMVRVEGEISDGGTGAAKFIIPALVKAFDDEKAKGVYIKINSPGGSPVQADLVCRRIKALKEKTHKKVVVMGEDVMASAAYLIAVCGDVLYSNPMSVVGSIGVKMENFGFTNVMQKIGVERRSVVAGENKTRLDPFKPVRQEDVQKIKSIVDQIHKQFIGIVTVGRGDKLKVGAKDLFTGDIWTGEQALELGLVDKLSDNYGALKNEFDVEYVKDYSQQPSFFDRIAKSVSVHMQSTLGLDESMQVVSHL